MVITVLKTHFNKIKPSNISYRSYKHFELDSFRNELNISLQAYDTNSMKYDQFKEIFMSILNKYAPIKSKIIRGNNGKKQVENRYNKFVNIFKDNKKFWKAIIISDKQKI